ncbi:MAG TPA: hypothetical protein VFX15_00135 [Actinomycetes bacterium]|nr:hypothetical protein [Actinomycetes bacterium]
MIIINVAAIALYVITLAMTIRANEKLRKIIIQQQKMIEEQAATLNTAAYIIRRISGRLGS